MDVYSGTWTAIGQSRLIDLCRLVYYYVGITAVVVVGDRHQ